MSSKNERKFSESGNSMMRRFSTASYPPQLPDVRRQSVPQRIFTSLEEKTTLKNALRLFRKYHRKHGTNITVKLFTDHEYLLEYFRLGDGSFNLPGIHKHVFQILDIIEELIETDFCRHKLMTNVRYTHTKKNIGEKEMLILLDIIKDYWHTILANQVSETYFIAVDNLFEQIMKYS